MTAAFGQLVDRLRRKGWSVEPAPLPPALADVPRHHRLIMSVEGLAFHRERSCVWNAKKRGAVQTCAH